MNFNEKAHIFNNEGYSMCWGTFLEIKELKMTRK